MSRKPRRVVFHDEEIVTTTADTRLRSGPPGDIFDKAREFLVLNPEGRVEIVKEDGILKAFYQRPGRAG